MGADIYLTWEGITKEEKDKQCTGFDVTSGKFGYLRGAYNGHIGYDAIIILFKEIKWENDWIVKIKPLKENLEKLKQGLFKTRKKDFYSKDGKDLEIQSYIDFVDLAEKLIKQGKKPKVHFSY